MKATKESPVIYLYFFSIILLMLNSMKVCWLWSVPPILFNFFAFFTTVITFVTTKIYKNQAKLSLIAFVYVLIVVISFLRGRSYNIIGLFFTLFIHPPVIISVFYLKDEYKHKLFECFVSTLTVILLITIPAWILFLGGFPFSHGPVYDVGDGFHFMLNYGFFVISYDSLNSSFPRFASVFLEPGWIGTLSCFVLFGLQFNFKRIATYLCAISIMLSMSLSAIVNLVVCSLLWIVLNSKHQFLYLFLAVSIFVGFGLFAVSYNNGNNVFNERIMERLVFDEDLGIVGNNRTNDEFDSKFEDVINGPDKWFGIGHEIDKEFRETNDWYNHSSGIKKEIMDNGFIGTGLFMLLLVLLLIKYHSKQGFVFFVCFIMASFIRNLWRSDCYLVLYIVALCTLYIGEQKIKSVIGTNNVRVVKEKNH